MSEAYLFGLIFFLGVAVGFIVPRRKRARVRKAKVLPIDPPNRKSSGPFSVHAKGRKPVVNDDTAAWRKENNMDLRDD